MVKYEEMKLDVDLDLDPNVELRSEDCSIVEEYGQNRIPDVRLNINMQLNSNGGTACSFGLSLANPALTP